MDDDEYTERHTKADQNESVRRPGMLGVWDDDRTFIGERRLGFLETDPVLRGVGSGFGGCCVTPKLSGKGIKQIQRRSRGYLSAPDCSHARHAAGAQISGPRSPANRTNYAAASLRTRRRFRDRSASQRSCCIC